VRGLIVVVAVLAAACGKPSSTSQPPTPPADAGTAAADAAAAAAAPADAAPAAPPATPDAGPLGARGDYCDQDADCGWDDPCMARRCGKAPEPTGCDKSMPPPGTCSCVENQCTLKPKDPALGASAPGCTTDADCAIDVGTATCHLKGTTLIGPIEQEGPVCTCNGGSRRCEFSWSGPVACKSWRDCSWVRQPRLRAVPARSVPRPFPRPVRACKDGEVDSVCKAGVCEIVGWSC
jgi:hypothetical protein